MHEMPIAMSIVEQSVQIADAHQAIHIEEIEVSIGRMRQVVPEALQLSFESAAEDTLAAGAALKIVDVAMVAECRGCGRQFEPQIDNYLCPACGQADVAIIAGNDMILTSIVCDTPEEARP